MTLFFATVLFLLSTKKVQNFIVQEITEQIEEQSGISVNIKNFHFKFPNKICLQEAQIEIPNYNQLLYAEELNFNFSFWEFIKKRIISDYLKIKGLEFKIHILEDGTSNIDFLKNIKFSGKGLSKINIKTIDIEDCIIAFDNDQKQKKGHQLFDPNHFLIKHFNATILLNEYAKNKLNTSIKNLSFKEKSGLQLVDLSTKIDLSEQSLIIPNIEIELNNSKIETDTIELSFKQINDILKHKKNVIVNATLKPSSILPTDLEALHPLLANFKKTIYFDGNLSGTLDSISFNNIDFEYENDLHLQGNLQLKNIEKTYNDIYVTANIERLKFSVSGLQDIIASAQRKPLTLPKELFNLGTCFYIGNIQGHFRNLQLNGLLHTNIGNIKTDVKLAVFNKFNDAKINGSITSRNLHLKKLFPNSQFGDISFNISNDTEIGHSLPFSSKIVAEVSSLVFQDYIYKNLHFDGELKKSLFLGSIIFDDENGKLNAQGSFDWNKNEPKFKFVAEVAEFNPYKTNLTKSYPNLAFSFKANSDFTGGDLDNMNGFFEICDINLKNAEKEYTLDKVRLSSDDIATNTHQMSVQSDIINGYITGSFIFKSLKNSILNLVKEYIPSSLGRKEKHTAQNNFIYNVNITKLEPLCNFLDIDWTTKDSINISGFYNDNKNDIAFNLNIPSIIKKGGKTSFKGLNIRLANDDKQLYLTANADIVAPKNTMSLHSNFQLRNDSLLSFIQWGSNKAQLFEGEIAALSAFNTKNDTLQTITNILPTQFVLRDSIWDIAPAKISTHSSNILIEDFSITKRNQFLTLNGKASKAPTDTIDIQLKNIDLSYISSFIPKASVVFSGEATGDAFVSNVFSKPIFNADIHVPKFSFNNAHWGDVTASAKWNNEKNAIDLEGVIKGTEQIIAEIEGNYFFSNDSLDLMGQANNLDIDFINYYLKDITLAAKGRASGDVHVFGKKKEITVTAKAKVDEAEMTVDYLKTTYSFSDSIILKPDSILFRNITVYDPHRNKGEIDGFVAHRYFKNFEYNIDINCDNVQAMNTNEKDNPYFYGLIFTSGDVNISGNDISGTTISAKATTEPKTKVFIPMSNSSTAMDNSFVVFINNDTLDLNSAQANTQLSSSDTNLKLLFMIDVTPDAETQIIIDPSSGDMIKATGEGNLKVDFDVKTGDFKLYGDYTLETGNYLFSLQNAIRKEFKIQKGSTIRWSGLPYNADVNITATYQLTASLADILDKAILSNSNRTSVPVQCILKLTGNLMRPNIAFDINLPNSDEELNRALKAVINTEEMMNRQVIYLLALGKFFTPEYIRSNTQGELLAIASSTLSSQLNSWASQLFENWNFGVNFRTSGEGNDKSNEYEFEFLYSPNERLVINGNVGYRDDNLSASKFIGDVDAEYKITSNGKIWLKAYNHTNDYKEFKTALTTQGVGLVYRESFSSGKALKKEWQKTIQRNKEERALKKQQRKEKREAKKQAKKSKQ